MGSEKRKIPTIATERLILRPFELTDTSEYFLYHNEPESIKFYDWQPRTLLDAKNDICFILDNYQDIRHAQWAITLKGCNTIIGDLGISCDGYKGELNYILSNKHLGQGLMTEALRVIISYYFATTDLVRIHALSHHENTSSFRLLGRLGFSEEGLLRKYGFSTITNQIVDLSMWALLKENFTQYSQYTVIEP